MSITITHYEREMLKKLAFQTERARQTAEIIARLSDDDNLKKHYISGSLSLFLATCTSGNETMYARIASVACGEVVPDTEGAKVYFKNGIDALKGVGIGAFVCEEGDRPGSFGVMVPFNLNTF